MVRISWKVLKIKIGFRKTQQKSRLISSNNKNKPINIQINISKKNSKWISNNNNFYSNTNMENKKLIKYLMKLSVRFAMLVCMNKNFFLWKVANIYFIKIVYQNISNRR